MSTVVDRCAACGTARAAGERLCAKCGSELPALPPDPGTSPDPAGALAWSYDIPVLNNRYVWVRWGWAALLSGTAFAVLLGTPLVVMFAAGNGGVTFAVKVYAVIALVAGLGAVGLGLFAALTVANSVTTRFALNPQSAVATTSEDPSAAVESAASLLASAQLRNVSAAAALLLPASGEAKWKDVRRAEFDERRNVITLRRRWHHPLRIYAPPETYGDAASFVREHAPATALRPDR